MTDPNELFDEDATPPDGFPVVAESIDDQSLDDGIRADRRVLLVSVVAVAILCYTGYIVVSLATRNHSQTTAQFNSGSSTSPPATATFEPTESAAPPTEAAATPIPTTQPLPVQSSTTQPVPTPPTTTRPPPQLCGAPANPYGYNFCGGSVIYSPAHDICSYLTCAANFWKGIGYVVQCQDDTFSKTGGGKQKVCSQDQGYRQTLFM